MLATDPSSFGTVSGSIHELCAQALDAYRLYLRERCGPASGAHWGHAWLNNRRAGLIPGIGFLSFRCILSGEGAPLLNLFSEKPFTDPFRRLPSATNEPKVTGMTSSGLRWLDPGKMVRPRDIPVETSCETVHTVDAGTPPQPQVANTKPPYRGSHPEPDHPRQKRDESGVDLLGFGQSESSPRTLAHAVG